MALKLITAPATEPVTLAQAKLACRIDDTDRDDAITAYIVAAREEVEHLTGRALITQTLELAIDAFPGHEIELPRPPVLSIVSVKYDDQDGAEQTLASSAYALDSHSEPAWLLPAYGTLWPSTLEAANAVRVRYTAGYGPAATDVPAVIKQWMLARIITLNDYPGDLQDARLVRPAYADRMLDRYCIRSI